MTLKLGLKMSSLLILKLFEISCSVATSVHFLQSAPHHDPGSIISCMHTKYFQKVEVELTRYFVDSFNALKGLRPPAIRGETEEGCLVRARNMELEIHFPLGPGVPRAKERHVKRTYDFLSFRGENK